jgi:hypothetical protein
MGELTTRPGTALIFSRELAARLTQSWREEILGRERHIRIRALHRRRAGRELQIDLALDGRVIDGLLVCHRWLATVTTNQGQEAAIRLAVNTYILGILITEDRARRVFGVRVEATYHGEDELDDTRSLFNS